MNKHRIALVLTLALSACDMSTEEQPTDVPKFAATMAGDTLEVSIEVPTGGFELSEKPLREDVDWREQFELD